MDSVIKDFAKAWESLNPELIIKHLDPNFQYDSQWAFVSLDVDGYANYIRGKFATLSRNGSNINVDIVHDSYCGGEMLKLVQNGNICYYRIRIENGRVVKGDMCMF